MTRPTSHASAPPIVPTEAEAPAVYVNADVAAIQALARGDANDEQQKRALDWIIVSAARTYDQPFRPDGLGGSRGTDFACGRMFVGQQIVKLTKIKLSKEG